MIIADRHDARMSYVDETDRRGDRMLRMARRQAIDEYGGKPGDRAALRNEFEHLDTGILNHLAVMWMITHTKWSGATGQGAVWAVASEIVNELAMECLRERPAFELMVNDG